MQAREFHRKGPQLLWAGGLVCHLTPRPWRVCGRAGRSRWRQERTQLSQLNLNVDGHLDLLQVFTMTFKNP